jgi:hypothetical protein
LFRNIIGGKPMETSNHAHTAEGGWDR